jgi:regulator of cell morphogenesis and NO signaling
MTITKENTVAEVVSKKLGSDHIFSKYNIDFCCGGGVTLENACKEIGVDFEVLKQEIDAINNKISGEQNLNDLDITTLMEQATEDFHQYIYETLPQIMPLSAKVAEVHGSDHKEVVEINNLMQAVEIVLVEMLKNTETSLFPAIESVLALNNSSADISTNQIESVKKALNKSEIAQHLVSDTFKEISKLSSHYTAPNEACNSYRFLYEKLHELDHKLQKYMHFNTHVFIPKILKIVA